MAVSFEPIGGGLSVAVDAHCRVSLDGIFLAEFAAPRTSETAMDLGSGNGLIPLWWSRRDPPRSIIAVEREAAFAALAKEAISRFSLPIDLRTADWNSITDRADVITCNPPYFRFGAARLSEDPLSCAARHEDRADALSLLCRTAARCLTDGGRFCLCHRPDRLADVMRALDEAGLVPRRLRFVQARVDAAPWLFLCEAGNRGALHVLPPLISNERGDHTAVYSRLYR